GPRRRRTARRGTALGGAVTDFLDPEDREMIATAVGRARADGVAEQEIERVTAEEFAHVDGFTVPGLCGKLYARRRLARLARGQPSSEASEGPVMPRPSAPDLW